MPAMPEAQNQRVRMIIYDEASDWNNTDAAWTDEPLYSNGKELEAQAKLTYRRHINKLANEQRHSPKKT
jgi:hypothetical protein